MAVAAGALRFGGQRFRFHSRRREYDIAGVAANRLTIHEHMRDVAVMVDASGSDFKQAPGFLALTLKCIGRVRVLFSGAGHGNPV